jgi:hypothetical protein
MAAVMVQHAVAATATLLAVLERRRPDLDPRAVVLAVAVVGCASVALGLADAGGVPVSGTTGHAGH